MDNARCAACKYLRRKCHRKKPDGKEDRECEFAPYFPSNNPQRFEHVHRIYGASNVAKMLEEVQPIYRAQVVETLCYEAESRIQDPVYGCSAIIFHLQQQIQNAECELAKLHVEIALLGSIAQRQEYEIQLMSTNQVHDPERFGSSSNASNWFN